MPQYAIIGLDLIAIAILAFGIYYPRNRRRDLAVAFVGVNVGVLAVSMVLGTSTVGAGLGLGLFGVLSIIRLRSREIEQTEVAYYFAALALGLIAGLSGSAFWLGAALMGLVVAVLAVVDSPRLLRRSREQTLTIDRAYTDEDALRAHIEQLLGRPISVLTVRAIDLVDDTTTVDVRYSLAKTTDASTRPGSVGSDAAGAHEQLPGTAVHS